MYGSGVDASGNYVSNSDEVNVGNTYSPSYGPSAGGGGAWGSGQPSNTSGGVATPNVSGWTALGSGTTSSNLNSSPANISNWTSPRPGVIRGGSSSGGGSSTSQTTTRTPTMPMPALKNMPEYTNPTWDDEAIKSYAQEDAALGIAETRDALYDSVNKIATMQGNPTAQAAAMREALKGHGAAIAQVMRGASKEALGRYQAMYQNQVNEAIARFNAGRESAMSQYLAEMQAYLNSQRITTDTTTNPADAYTRPTPQTVAQRLAMR